MSIDYALTQSLNSLASKNAMLDALMIGISEIGPYLLVGLIAIRWWAKQNRISQRHLAIGCGVATALGLFLNQCILLFYHRPRPYESGLTRLLIQKSSDPSFPSDHATLGIAIAVFLLLGRDRWGIWFFLASFVIGISRIFIGTHYATDVLGGAVTGAVAAFIVALIYARLEPLTKRAVQIL